MAAGDQHLASSGTSSSSMNIPSHNASSGSSGSHNGGSSSGGGGQANHTASFGAQSSSGFMSPLPPGSGNMHLSPSNAHANSHHVNMSSNNMNNGLGNTIQRSRSPHLQAPVAQGFSQAGGGGGAGGGMSIPNGRFLDVGGMTTPDILPGFTTTSASKMYTAVGGGAGSVNSNHRISTSPSSVGRQSERMFGSGGSNASALDSIHHDIGVLEGINHHHPHSDGTAFEVPPVLDDDEQHTPGGGGGVPYSAGGPTNLDVFARRSPRPDASSLLEARRPWTAGPTSQSQNGASIIGPPGGNRRGNGGGGQGAVNGQAQGPGSLGGTPTRGVGGGGRPGNERSHSRFSTVPINNGSNSGGNPGSTVMGGPAGVPGGNHAHLSLGGGLERPQSAMSIKSNAVGGGGGVAGVTDSTGRMESQALVVSSLVSRCCIHVRQTLISEPFLRLIRT